MRLMKYACVVFVPGALPYTETPLETHIRSSPVSLNSHEKMNVPFVARLTRGVGDIGQLRVSGTDQAHPLCKLPVNEWRIVVNHDN